jgi:prevent-host-death family protein
MNYMIAKLREAKEQLSELVKRAAGGEDIIITVRGQPMARLSSLQPSANRSQNHGAFADELALLANSVRTNTIAINPQTAWDELRQDRF